MEENGGLDAFNSARAAIVRRAMRLCGIAAKQLAVAYKIGDPFPSHFVWNERAYLLDVPDVLREATKRQCKNKDFLEGVFASIVADREWDRFATLIIGLTTAQKIVTHWSEVDEDEQ